MVRIHYADFAIRRPGCDAKPTAVGERVDSLLAASGNGQREHPVKGQPWQAKAECRVGHSWVKLPAAPQRQELPLRKRHTCGAADHATAVTNDALNKVTGENYERILLRILTSIRTSPEPLLIFRAILRKCYEQDFFVQVYLRIVTDVLEQALGDETGVMARLDLSDFASQTMSLDLLTSFPRSLGNTNASGSGYDGFCERVKAKKHLVGRARTTMGLIERGIVSKTREDFFQSTVIALEGFCSKPRSPSVSDSAPGDPQQSELDYDDDHADIAIEYLKEIVGVREAQTPCRLHRLGLLLETHVRQACSLMCRFKMQGILGVSTLPRPAPVPTPDPDGGGQWKTIANGVDRRRGGRQHTNVRL